jgi:hypothetical protein
VPFRLWQTNIYASLTHKIYAWELAQGQGAGVEACETHIMDISVSGTHIFFAIDISITWDHCSSVQNTFQKEHFMFNSNAIPPLLHIVPTAVLEFITLWDELL